MTQSGLDELNIEDLDFVILENVGNLVCPAEFDTGASKSAMILSVPEGDDKPLKYPLMFSEVDVLVVNKIDVLPYFNFDTDAVKERAQRLNPGVPVIEVSALNGQGIDGWTNWLRGEIRAWNNSPF